MLNNFFFFFFFRSLFNTVQIFVNLLAFFYLHPMDCKNGKIIIIGLNFVNLEFYVYLKTIIILYSFLILSF